MKKSKILSLGGLALAGVCMFTGCSVSQKDGEEWAANHGYIKASDYNIDTKDTVTRSSQDKETVDNQLTQAQIKQLVLDQLRGFVLYWYKGEEVVYPEYEEGVYPHVQDKEQIAQMESEGYTPVYSYREMYQIATSHNNVPTISSVEYVLDTGTMKLYGSSEKGTAKVEDIVANPNVSLYWTKQVDEDDYFAASSDTNDYWRSYGVQIIGSARIIDGEKEPEVYAKAFDLYMNTMRGSKEWDAMPEATKAATREKLKTLNVWYEITPTQINSHNLWNMYNKDNVCSTAEIVETDGVKSVKTTVQTCPTVSGEATEEAIKAEFIAHPELYPEWHVNETATLNSTQDDLVWSASASAGSLYKWSGGIQRKWAKALFNKAYRQVLTQFDVTPEYPASVTEKNL